MHYCVTTDALVSVYDLLENQRSLILRQLFATFDGFGQISSFTVLSHDAGVCLEGNDLMYSDDVGSVAQQSQYLDLIIEKCLVHFSLHVLGVDELHSDGLSWIDKGVPLVSLMPL